MVPIPEEARFELTQLRASLSEKDYLDHMWKLRYPKRSRKPRGRWPLGEDESLSNVTKLPARMKATG